MKTAGRYLTADEAAESLGITRATLYAYASRGQLRSEPIPGRPRERRYYREDLERLLERKDARRDPAKAAARGLHWGGPVLESGITLIHNGRFYYRGQDAISLAETATLEEVAALLWAAEETERERLFEQPCAVSVRHLAQLRTFAKEPFNRFGILRFASGRGPADRRSYCPIAHNVDRAPRRAVARSSGTSSGMGTEEEHGRRRHSNGAGSLCRSRTERFRFCREVRGFRRRLTVRRRLRCHGNAERL